MDKFNHPFTSLEFKRYKHKVYKGKEVFASPVKATKGFVSGRGVMSNGDYITLHPSHEYSFIVTFMDKDLLEKNYEEQE